MTNTSHSSTARAEWRLGIALAGVFDPLITLFLTATIMAYYLADQEPDQRRRLLYFTLCGVACGAAFLTKGFLAYAVPVLVIAPYLATGRAWRKLALTGLIPLAASVVVALPWSVLIHLREPDFWRYFFIVEHVHRFASETAQHHRPVWFFVALLPIAAFPWIFLAPAGLKGLRRSGMSYGLLKLLALWIAIPLLFFSLARGKLATYILPCFPPLAMLVAIDWDRSLASPPSRALRLGLSFPLGINAMGLIALALNDSGHLGPALFNDSELVRHALLYLALFTALLLGSSAMRARGGAQLRLAAVASAILPICVLGTLAFPSRAGDMIAPAPFLADAAGAIPPGALLISDGDLFGALSWYARRDDVYLMTSRGELDYGLSYQESAPRYLDAISSCMESGR